MKPIVITGFMGCGKTRLARELGRHLNIPMVDLDQFITEREGRSPAQIIVQDGEPAFRAVESDALRDLLLMKTVGLIALGGGAWIEQRNRALIEQYSCITVWLDIPFEVCWARIEAAGEDRPLGKSKDEALALYERRRPVYQLAKIHLGPEEDLEVLVSRLKNQ